MQSDKKVPDRKTVEVLGPTEPFVSNLTSYEDRWNWFLGIGVTLVILGILAIVGAQIASIVSILFLGIFLLAGAITKFIAAFWARQWSGFWLSLLIAVLYIVASFICLTKPLRTLEALTIIMSVLFLVGGISKIISSLYLRFESWGWVFLSGIVSFLLGAFILAEWPEISLWLVGTFLGVDLLISGWVWIALACESRRIAKEQGKL